MDELLAQLGLPRPADAEIDAALRLARVVAHGTERKAAPLVCYAAGLVLTAATDPAERAARLEALLAAARDLTAAGDADG